MKNHIPAITGLFLLGATAAQAGGTSGSIIQASEDDLAKCTSFQDIFFLGGDKPGQPKFVLCGIKKVVETASTTGCPSVWHNIAWRTKLIEEFRSEYGAEATSKYVQRWTREQAEYEKAREAFCPDLVN